MQLLQKTCPIYHVRNGGRLSVCIHNTKPLFLKYAQQNIVLVVHFVPAKTPHSLARWYRTDDENYISSVTLRSYNINVLYGS